MHKVVFREGPLTVTLSLLHRKSLQGGVIPFEKLIFHVFQEITLFPGVNMGGFMKFHLEGFSNHDPPLLQVICVVGASSS